MKIFGIWSILMNEAFGGDEGGGGGGTTAVADAGTGADLTVTDETALATTDQADPSGELETTQNTDPARGDQSGKSASTQALAVLKDHPALKQWTNTALRSIAARQEIGKLFPGQSPIAGVKALQADMTALAGRYYNQPDPKDPQHRTGIQQVRDRLADAEQLDLLYYSGDPKIFENMTSDEEGKAAFVKLAPHYFAKFRQIAPKAFAAAFARQSLGSMKYDMLHDDKGNEVEPADIQLRLRRTANALQPGKDADGKDRPLDLNTAITELNAMWAYVTSIQEMAKLAPEVFTPEATTTSKVDEREQRVAQRETEQRNNEWNAARTANANKATNALWRQLTKGKEISPGDASDTEALYHIRFNRSIQANEPKADENRRAYIESGDKEGYLVYEKYLLDTYGVPALKAETKKLLERLATGRPRTAGAPTAGTSGRSQPQAIPQGWTKLATKPLSHEMDYTRMTPDMVRSNQGILRANNSLGKPAGFKVCW